MANNITTAFPSTNADFMDAMCDHVEENRSLAYRVYREDDSFGPVGRYVVCKECYNEEQNQLSMDECCDCHQRKPQREMRQWRWYDFYAAQGDEPLHICSECMNLPKHKERVRKDSEERRAEDDYYESRPIRIWRGPRW